ncbi:MAG: TetR family transcriptional regulator [Burkholderiales bacterium]|nr:TetR family transcriptional regulator [Burkholderiales bacterium]
MSKVRQKILKAGIKFFGDIPYDKVSVEDITNLAQVNISSVSYYFGGKENLYKEVINSLNQAVIDQLSKIDVSSLASANLHDARLLVTQVMDELHYLCVSSDGRSRVNIFLREITSIGNDECKNLFSRHVEFSYNFPKSALIIYYKKLGANIDALEFRLTVFFSVLKDLATNPQKPTQIKNIYNDDTYANLVNFMFEVNQ